MTRLETRSLGLVVAGRVLCKDLSVAFSTGENWAVLGPNGSGKTTLLHTLAGLRPPEAGGVWLDGEPILRLPPRRRAQRLSLLFQHYDGALDGNVIETVLTGRHPHLPPLAWEGGTDLAIARAALAEVGLEGFETRGLATLSGGERRRIEIAALLAQDTPACLLDEPTQHLDLHHQTGLLARLTARAGRLNILVLHDLHLAVRFATHALLMFGDGTHCHGPLADVFTQPNLERLYRCRLTPVEADGRTFYLPS
jgi:iron complex transport system ATP-binding protein